MTIRDSLAQVQELLGRATPGELLARVIERDGEFRDAFVVVPSKIQGTSVVGDYPMEWMADDSYHEAEDAWQKAHDARATAAAVNWLREHGPELMKMLDRHGAGDVEDTARYRWLRKHALEVVFHDASGCVQWPDDAANPEDIDRALDKARAGERG